jgi:signal transduction histidine kinase
MVYRYRYVSDLRQRQQTKWVLTAIVQEALTNVIKHAQAQRCQIRLAAAAEQLRIEICDDG